MSDFDLKCVEIAKLELERGDALIVRVPSSWTHEQCVNADNAIRATLDRAGKEFVPVLFGMPDVEFTVVKRSA